MAPGNKVLIVDDERWTSDTLAVIFSTSGYDARAAYSAEQALEMVTQWMPAMAIVDVVLPKMNGVELAIHLATRCPACQILLFSGQERGATIVEEAESRGHYFHLLAKPVHPNVMLTLAAHRLPLWKSDEG